MNILKRTLKRILNRFFVHELVQQRSAYTLDALLSPVVAPKVANMTGIPSQTWVGFSRSEMDRMSVAEAARVADAGKKRLTDYIAERRSRDGYGNETGGRLSSGSMAVDPAGVLSTGVQPQDRPEKEFGVGDSAALTLANCSTAASFAAALRKRNAASPRAAPAGTHDRRGAPASIADMNVVNKDFWARLTPQSRPYWLRKHGQG